MIDEQPLSKLLKPGWKLSYHSEPTIPSRTRSRTTMEQEEDKRRLDRPYILNLIPHISPLHPRYSNSAQAYRDQFESEYEKSYMELAKKRSNF
jgi:hypothetical protein